MLFNTLFRGKSDHLFVNSQREDHVDELTPGCGRGEAEVSFFFLVTGCPIMVDEFDSP